MDYWIRVWRVRDGASAVPLGNRNFRVDNLDQAFIEGTGRVAFDIRWLLTEGFANLALRVGQQVNTTDNPVDHGAWEALIYTGNDLLARWVERYGFVHATDARTNLNGFAVSILEDPEASEDREHRRVYRFPFIVYEVTVSTTRHSREGQTDEGTDPRK